MPSKILSTFTTSVQAIVTVAVVYFCGFLLVRFRLVDRAGVKVLSTISNYLFIPFMFFISMASGLDLETLKHAWRLPVIGLLIEFLQFLFAYLVVVHVAKPTPEFRQFYILGQATSNIVALPLILVSSVCQRVTFKKPEYVWDHPINFYVENNLTDEIFLTEDECVERGYLYLFLYGLLINMYLWTFGYEFVMYGKEESNHENLPLKDEEKTANGFPVDEAAEALVKGKEDKVVEKEIRDYPVEQSNASLAKDLCQKAMLGFTRPTTISQIIGIFCGLIAPIRETLFNDDGKLQSVSSGLQIIAEAGEPAINLILACSLSLKIMDFTSWKDFLGHEEKVGISTKTLLVFAFSRMVFIPGFFLLCYFLIEKYLFDLAPEDDNLLHFIIYIELLTPTANIIVVIAQMANQPKNGEILAMGILLQYMIGFVSITGYMFVSLYTLDLL